MGSGTSKNSADGRTGDGRVAPVSLEGHQRHVTPPVMHGGWTGYNKNFAYAAQHVLSQMPSGHGCPKCRETGVYYVSGDCGMESMCSLCNVPHCNKHAHHYHKNSPYT